MARQQAPESDTSGQVPLWFVTYSDVITLLMTFFILLLTFATSEPEKFEQMQTTMYGSSGARGMLDKARESKDRDSLLVRQRPNSARIAVRGSEMPPIYSDPVLQSLSKGMKSLESEPQHTLTTSYTLMGQLEVMVDNEDQVSATGRQWLHMMAEQLKRLPFDIQFHVNSQEDASKAYVLARHLMDFEHLAPGQIAIGVDPSGRSSNSTLRITLVRTRTFASNSTTSASGGAGNAVGAGDLGGSSSADSSGGKQTEPSVGQE